MNKPKFGIHCIHWAAIKNSFGRAVINKSNNGYVTFIDHSQESEPLYDKHQ